MNSPYFDLNITALRRLNMTAEEQQQGGITYCTLRQWIERTMRPDETITAIHKLCPDLKTKEANADEVGRLKKRLNAVVLSAILFGGMGKDNITERVPLMDIDIDGKDNPWITDFDAFKQQLFKSMNNGRNVLYMGKSVSNNGLWLIIPLAYPDRYEEQFQSIKLDFASKYVEKIFGHPIVIDNKSANIACKRYLSYDAAPIINDQAQPYKGILPQPPRKIYRKVNGQSFDVEAWLRTNGVPYTIREKTIGTQYVVPCPWAAQHSGGEGKRAHVLWQYHDTGAVEYHCFHNSCSCHKWKDYKRAIETNVL